MFLLNVVFNTDKNSRFIFIAFIFIHK